MLTSNFENLGPHSEEPTKASYHYFFYLIRLSSRIELLLLYTSFRTAVVRNLQAVTDSSAHHNPGEALTEIYFILT